ncbi:hypothetical protein LZ554_000843 [Drepanopeziza brunnea f. sp. 'monogermtubi']|nr:hypothetical protein LZ554_000843 [Drepanopeziza brunnea f. sp. 'monogermtubi']
MLYQKFFIEITYFLLIISATMRFILSLSAFVSAFSAAGRTTASSGAITVGSGGTYPTTTDTSSYATNVFTITHSSSLASGAADDEATSTVINEAVGASLYNVNIKNTYGKGSQAVALAACGDSRHSPRPSRSTAGSGTVYLGRPSSEFARVVVQSTTLGSNIDAAGWEVWSSSDGRTDAVTFAEYGNTGTGASEGCASFATKLSSAITTSTVLRRKRVFQLGGYQIPFAYLKKCVFDVYYSGGPIHMRRVLRAHSPGDPNHYEFFVFRFVEFSNRACLLPPQLAALWLKAALAEEVSKFCPTSITMQKSRRAPLETEKLRRQFFNIVRPRSHLSTTSFSPDTNDSGDEFLIFHALQSFRNIRLTSCPRIAKTVGSESQRLTNSCPEDLDLYSTDGKLE